MNDVHALSGAYAVDALDDIERAHFERHLAECASCRSEVDSLQEAAALLGETTAMEPPASLRTRILAEVATVRPLPPLVAATVERGRPNRSRFPTLVAAAAALIAFGAVGATVWDPWSEDRPNETVSAAQRVLDASDAETFTRELGDDGTDAATATVTRSRELDLAVLSTTGLSPLPDGQVYELWLMRDNGEILSAGLMKDPNSTVVLNGNAEYAAQAGITIEDEDGPPGPDLSRLVGTVPFENG
ncbi:MAG: anti-sigma factor [Actinomycetota bacterium]|nr:anti-sigma factor [Actinomycetota bacterium]